VLTELAQLKKPFVNGTLAPVFLILSEAPRLLKATLVQWPAKCLGKAMIVVPISGFRWANLIAKEANANLDTRASDVGDCGTCLSFSECTLGFCGSASLILTDVVTELLV
jgi:hypothetical protein